MSTPTRRAIGRWLARNRWVGLRVVPLIVAVAPLVVPLIVAVALDRLRHGKGLGARG